jgi:geranylgeranylglycerol-phosphate geranylgeranyltransferase
MLFKKLKSLLLITRPVNCLITFFSILVGAIICVSSVFSVTNMILAALSGGLTAAAGNIINDLFDFEIDKVNRPERALPSGQISKNGAVVFYLILQLGALLLSYFISSAAFVIVLFTALLLFFYSYKLKKLPLVGNLSVAFMTGLAFVYGGVSVSNFHDALIPAFFAFLINLVREVIKDMEDVKGDSSEGVLTFPQRFGFAPAKIIVLIFSLLLIIAALIPYINNIYGIKYFLIIVILVDPILLYTIASLFKDDSIKNLNKLSFILKLNMLFGLTAIFLGK